MTRTHRALCTAATALLLLTACGADDDEDVNNDSAAPETTAAPGQETPTSQEETSGDDAEGDAEDEVFATAEIVDVAGNPIGTFSAAEAEGGGVRLIAEVQDRAEGFRAIAVHENGVCETQSTDADGQIGDYYSAGEVLTGTVEDDPGVAEGEDELAETPAEETDEAEDTGGEAPQQPESPGGADQPTAPEGGEDPNAAAELIVEPAGQLPAQGQAPAQPETQQPPEADEVPRADRAGTLPNLLINPDGTGHLEVVSARLSEEELLQDDGTAVIIYTEADHHGNVPQRYAPYGPDAQSSATGDAGQRAACGVLERSQ